MQQVQRCAAVLASLVFIAGCAQSTKEQARSRALSRLRESAEQLREYGNDVLGSATSSHEALRRLREDQPAVLGGRTDGDEVTWNAVFVAKGSEGGGLDFEDIILRTCVQYGGRVGLSDSVTWQRAECPPSIQNERQFGPYDETVHLDSRR